MIIDRDRPPPATTPRSRLGRGAVLLLLLAVLGSVSESHLCGSQPAASGNAASANDGPADAAVSFSHDVEPILKRRCWSCHGAERAAGGLRLDDADRARAGGDSGLPLFSDDPAESELFQRITDPDITIRMPKGEAPLTAAELETIRAWLAGGAAWPAAVEPAQAELETTSERERWEQQNALWMQYTEWTEPFESELRIVRPLFYLALAGLILLLLVERVRRRHANSSSPPRGAERVLLLLRRGHFVLGLVVLVSAGWILILQHHQTELSKQNKQLAGRVKQLQGEAAALRGAGTPEQIFGTPPQPRRPSHARRLAGTYYRGNCERNPRLFNHGNYLTATFQIALCDDQHQTLEYGQSRPPGGCYVRLEIERAPKTAAKLFAAGLMGSVFLTPEYSSHPAQLKQQVPLTTLQPDQRWEAVIPIDDPPAPNRNTIYLYKGSQAHYGITYRLDWDEQGRLGPQSEIWMGSVYTSPRIAIPRTDQIPWLEWLDHRPLPVITGKNATDPDLLGIPEHELSPP